MPLYLKLIISIAVAGAFITGVYFLNKKITKPREQK